MQIENYMKSLTAEVGALRDRVRHLIEDRHWLTDGEWKESVIRQILRRHLPITVNVGRGFVVTASATSHQLDVLIFKSSKPVLFRDGDLAFVTPDAVVGIVEVKSSVTPKSFSEAAKKLASDIQLVRKHPNFRAFAALFAFKENSGDSSAYLQALADSASSANECLDFASIGDSRFIRYWELTPEDERRMYERWHSYNLPRMAPGYFVHNVIDAVSSESVFSNKEVWFPSGGKEPYLDDKIKAVWARG